MEKSEAVRILANKHLVPFILATDPNYDVSWHHELICETLEWAVSEVEAGRKARIIFELPPRHSKSETATKKFPAWALGRHPDWPIIVASYSSDLAKDFGEATRDLMQEQNYQAIFNTRLKTDRKARDRWATDQKGYYTAAGVGGAITGKGFKIGIIDDPFKNRKDADSLLQRDNVWKWYSSTFYTRQNDEANCIIIINTRWHFDDLTGRVLAKEEENRKNNLPTENWKRICLPAIAVEDEEFRKKGEVLWAERFSHDHLMKIKANIDIMDWAALYQQMPLLNENAEFKKEYFKKYSPEEIKDLKLVHKTTVDLAISKKESADESSVLTGGKADDDPRIFFREYDNGRWDPYELMKKIFEHVRRYNSDVYIETVAYQKALKYILEEEMRRQNFYFNIYELKGRNNTKEQRIRGLIPPYRNGIIHHTHAMQELELQLLAFPQAKHDDIADTAADQLQAHMNTIPKSEERKRSRQEDSAATRYEGTLDPEMFRREQEADDTDKWEDENLAQM